MPSSQRAAADVLPIYVVHWNAPAWVRSTTDAFLQSTIPTIVTVVDNGPYDVPIALDERVRVVRSGSNRGYAGGANVGIAEWLAGEAEFCVVACHDVRLEPDGLATLIGRATDVPEFGIVAPEPTENIAAGPVVNDGEQVREVQWASGACLVLRRSCIEEVGPFDESFGSYVEDVDLCLRAGDAGWKIAVVPGVAARGEGSTEPRFRGQMYVNQVRLRAKRAGRMAALRMLAAFVALAVRDYARWIFVRDPVLVRRASGRIRAVPEGARLMWSVRREETRG